MPPSLLTPAPSIPSAPPPVSTPRIRPVSASYPQTLAFLIPTIENMIKRGPPAAANGVRALILSPTRELAYQIAKEAETLTQFHDGMNVACFVGGVNMTKDMTRLRSKIDILVATPGRLQDHLTNTPGFVGRLGSVQTLILVRAG